MHVGRLDATIDNKAANRSEPATTYPACIDEPAARDAGSPTFATRTDARSMCSSTNCPGLQLLESEGRVLTMPSHKRLVMSGGHATIPTQSPPNDLRTPWWAVS
jgi:hypothetical protein